jgi:hypothetical protein
LFQLASRQRLQRRPQLLIQFPEQRIRKRDDMRFTIDIAAFCPVNTGQRQPVRMGKRIKLSH